MSLLPDAVPFRVNCKGLLLTYQSFRTATVWPAFKAWVRASIEGCRALYHGATMEFNDPARAGAEDVRHLHLMLRFRQKVDVQSDVFAYHALSLGRSLHQNSRDLREGREGLPAPLAPELVDGLLHRLLRMGPHPR